MKKKDNFWTPATIEREIEEAMDTQFMMRDELNKTTERRDKINWNLAIKTNSKKVIELHEKLLKIKNK
jgi:hypothetical protein